MPNRAPRLCSYAGCGSVSTDGYCDKHKKLSGWESDTVRGNRHERGYGTKWDKLRLKILKRDNYLCTQCKRNGKVTAGTQVDHIKPKLLGGTDNSDNLQTLCVPCHKQKTINER